jgi:hypothetical protein
MNGPGPGHLYRRRMTCNFLRSGGFCWGIKLSSQIIFLGLFAALAGSRARAVDPNPLVPIAPFPDTVAFAASHGLPLGGIAPGDGGPARKGDEVTLLVTRYRGAVAEQWVARLRADDLTDKERSEKRPDAITYSGTGRVLHYGFTPAALQVAFAGPFRAAAASGRTGAAVAEKDKRLVTNAQFMNFGLDEFCRVQLKEMRLRSEGVLQGPGMYYSSYPPSPAVLANSKRIEALLHLTAEEDRITGGCWYPLSSFVDMVTSVTEFERVVFRVLDLPSVWSILKHGGVFSGWNFGNYAKEAGPYGSTGLPLYRFALQLNMNGQPALKAAALVVAPRPPFEVCAGLTGIYLERPSDPTQRMFIQVVAARRATLP